ncbi:hypothetical protein AB0J90_13310 [Micromonospora sp. NPDC049523]|uniref:hypothetical protein n=1 Tax=Micromonospora sp. NPDC049523 TaxID=3155921 RepID=UPI003436C966
MGPAAALPVVEALTGLDHHHVFPAVRADHVFHAVRADLLRGVGCTEQAAAAYRRAAALTDSNAGRRFLDARRAALHG